MNAVDLAKRALVKLLKGMAVPMHAMWRDGGMPPVLQRGTLRIRQAEVGAKLRCGGSKVP